MDEEAHKAADQPAEQASPVPKHPDQHSGHATTNDSNSIQNEQAKQADGNPVTEPQVSADVDPELEVQAASDVADAIEGMQTGAA